MFRSRFAAARWILPALLLSASATTAVAAEWHVAVDGPADGDGSATRPFSSLHEADAVAVAGDRILVGPGAYSQTRTISVDGRARRVLLQLIEGVEVVGSGRGSTILRAPDSSGAPIFAVTGAGVGRGTVLRDLTLAGPCFQGVNLRGAAPTLLRVEILIDVTGSSSTALDARDGSAPLCREVLFDGGHSALFVEFGSAGVYEDCTITRRPNEGIAISDATGVFRRCWVEGAGRDTVVLNLGAQPVFEDCWFGRGDRWTVRVAAGYEAGTVLDLSGNRWFDPDPEVIAAAIRDADDDPALGARVSFLPLADPVFRARESMGGWKARFGGR